MAVDRRAWWGGAALVALIALVIWTLGSGAVPVTSRATPARSAPAGLEAPRGTPAAVQLERLAGDKGSPAGVQRNPFAFGARVVPPRPVGETPRPQDAAPVVNRPPPGPPPTAPIALKFIGIVEAANGMKLAVLTDGRVVSHGQEGDIIDGRYRILKIGVESIEIAHADGSRRQTIRLTGQ